MIHDMFQSPNSGFKTLDQVQWQGFLTADSRKHRRQG